MPSTFGGNPVAIAAALKTIELLERELVANSAEVGAYLKQGLEKLMSKYDCIGDVRGMGLMLGVEFIKDGSSKQPDPELRDRVEMASFQRGLILLGCGNNSIRWSPPLILNRDHVDVALEILRRSHRRVHLVSGVPPLGGRLCQQPDCKGGASQ
jgi:4-aminobutyrate aminotransferase